MTTTFVRLKNRRGNKADLPKPLAEGELGFATDTRELYIGCLLYTSPSPRDATLSRMPSSA